MCFLFVIHLICVRNGLLSVYEVISSQNFMLLLCLILPFSH